MEIKQTNFNNNISKQTSFTGEQFNLAVDKAIPTPSTVMKLEINSDMKLKILREVCNAQKRNVKQAEEKYSTSLKLRQMAKEVNLKSKKDLISDTKKSLNDAQKAVSLAEKKYSVSQNLVNISNKQYLNAKKSQTSAQKSLTEKNDTLSKLMEQIKSLNTNYENTDKNLAQRIEKKETIKETIASLNEKYITLKENKSNIEAEREKINQDYIVNGTTENLDEYKKSLNNLETQMSYIDKELNDIQQKIDIAIISLKTSEEIEKKLTNKANSIKIEILTSNQSLKTIKQEKILASKNYSACIKASSNALITLGSKKKALSTAKEEFSKKKQELERAEKAQKRTADIISGASYKPKTQYELKYQESVKELRKSYSNAHSAKLELNRQIRKYQKTIKLINQIQKEKANERTTKTETVEEFKIDPIVISPIIAEQTTQPEITSLSTDEQQNDNTKVRKKPEKDVNGFEIISLDDLESEAETNTEPEIENNIKIENKEQTKSDPNLEPWILEDDYEHWKTKRDETLNNMDKSTLDKIKENFSADRVNTKPEDNNFTL